MTDRVADFEPLLKAAIAEAKAAGLVAAATRLEEQAFATYATSSEWLGETGTAILSFIASERSAIPSAVVAKLNICLAEVQKVWPSL